MRASTWRDLTPDLIARIASYSHPNDVAGCIKLLDRETAICLRENRRLVLAAPPKAWPLHNLPQLAAQPWPGDAFVRHWGRPEPWRVLSLRERRRLLCLAASSGHAASLASAVAYCDCGLHVHALESAAAVGDIAACATLLDAGCQWAHSVFAAAAGAGHLPVCRAFWAAGLRPPPPRHTRSAAVEAACRGGHAHVLHWLEEVGYVRVLPPPPPPTTQPGPSTTPLPSPPPPEAPPAAAPPALSQPAVKQQRVNTGNGTEAKGQADSSSINGSGAAHPSSATVAAAGPPAAAAAAPDAPFFMHGFAALSAAHGGHTELVRRLLDFGRCRYQTIAAGRRSGTAADDGNGARGGGGCDGGRLLDGVTRPHRQGLMTTHAFGCTMEEFVEVYHAYLEHEWPAIAAAAAGAPGGAGGGGSGGFSLRELHSVLLQRAISSPRPDGSWADKFDFILARQRELEQELAGAMAGAVADTGPRTGVAAAASGPGAADGGLSAAERANQQAPAAGPLLWPGLDDPWSVWEGAARHPDAHEVERRMRFLVSRGLVPGPGALKAAAAAGSAGALCFLLDECGLQPTPAFSEWAARSARLESVRLLHARYGLRLDERLLAAALAGLRGPGGGGGVHVAACGCDHGYGDTYSGGGFNRCAAEAVALVRWLLEQLAAERAEEAEAEAEEGVGCTVTGSGGGAPSQVQNTADGPPWTRGRSRTHVRRLGEAFWLAVLEEACVTGVSDLRLLQSLAARADAEREEEGRQQEEQEAGEEGKRLREAVAARVVQKLLMGGSPAAMEWAAHRLRAQCSGLPPEPLLTPAQLWVAACGGNFAAVRAACAAGLARIPDWLPDCAYDATLRTPGGGCSSRPRRKSGCGGGRSGRKRGSAGWDEGGCVEC
ncbi:hypothetical protein CHLRE_06g276150v5 [Chlamydomonas reinhardtii]|uniref:Uncharacterized protein n=1 Tax=Chlamydomonas reinhardtii TaxID=3055 RepID=A0A2K3DNP7_CHLRE|nr:uncharacterized protein CHLRE_06g276150v5 [Chlamydomonas reinhardtii]PNW82148.1 hypothetical protein CHLRE_06g276150v5 [Chlamydomonas reinhardtii]